jgi:hypothetical protein
VIQRIQANPGATDGKVSCTINFGYDSDAFFSGSIVGATANANFSSNCAFSGEVYSYAYSKGRALSGLLAELIKTDGPRSGANVSTSAVSSVNGVTECYSHAESSMTTSSLNPSSYYIVDDNYTCPSATPLNVTVTSNLAADVYVLGYNCANITWTTGISGGTPAYSTTMYKNNVFMTNATSFASSFCGSNTNATQTVTVSANVTDSLGQAKSASQVTTIHYSVKLTNPPPACSVYDGSGKITYCQ